MTLVEMKAKWNARRPLVEQQVPDRKEPDLQHQLQFQYRQLSHKQPDRAPEDNHTTDPPSIEIWDVRSAQTDREDHQSAELDLKLLHPTEEQLSADHPPRSSESVQMSDE
jgi:hypothetical protein